MMGSDPTKFSTCLCVPPSLKTTSSLWQATFSVSSLFRITELQRSENESTGRGEGGRGGDDGCGGGGGGDRLIGVGDLV